MKYVIIVILSLILVATVAKANYTVAQPVALSGVKLPRIVSQITNPNLTVYAVQDPANPNVQCYFLSVNTAGALSCVNTK